MIIFIADISGIRAYISMNNNQHFLQQKLCLTAVI